MKYLLALKRDKNGLFVTTLLKKDYHKVKILPGCLCAIYYCTQKTDNFKTTEYFKLNQNLFVKQSIELDYCAKYLSRHF